ncbi:helix-turn-helix transcriptional regulator [Burkholderia lata]|uniref:Transcriptional regulator, AraC family n=1 Tax=Burkholderia lata (strain ATCC 17760 / DSM 23089 / LMG 22485 / NCIMB 9086 / R18194 / 383) TaxID=482957 RepID=Q399R6_BURL3|nr:AraC family transcriptional regulator [Burkholderia lata]ABB10795.1 transcriptional regulator, AraC family [Burkholderia lata]
MLQNLYSPYLDYDSLSRELAVPPANPSVPDFPSTVIRQIGNGHHYRVEYANAYADGQTEFHAQSPAFWMTSVDVSFAGVVRRRTRGQNTLRIRVGRGGAASYAVGGREISLDGPSMVLVAEPDGMPAGDVTERGHHQVTSICLHRSALSALYAGAEEALPLPLRHFVEGTLTESFMHAGPISPAMFECLRDIGDCSLDGRSRSIYLHGRSLEIVARAIDSVSDATRHAGDEAGHGEVSRMTRRAVSKAQSVLEEHFAAPPSLDVLSRQVGLSRSSLCAGFRTLLGKSVHEYAHELRMQQALRLLREPGVPVTDVAYAVGYNHPSSFSVAIQKRFGMSPRELRARGGAVMADRVPTVD